jgi:DNA mismatch endonuclease (patch repair protein)
MPNVRAPEEVMTDTLSTSERSRAMAKVRSADTKPEWILRCGLHRLGFRYKLSDRALPGRPYLVFPKYKSVIFVHGCYWHRHKHCKDASTPKSNTEFWLKKFAENVRRDRSKVRALDALGWRVLVLWECQLTKCTTRTIQEAALWLAQDVLSKSALLGIGELDRRTLLTVAEAKVRYRLSNYSTNLTGAKRPAPGDSES